jgi:hypothetical protein
MRFVRFVHWLSNSDLDKSIRLDYHWISMHAISRDPESYPMPCIYCQLDLPPAIAAFGAAVDSSSFAVAADGQDDGEDDEGDDDMDPLPELTEVRFVPAEESARTNTSNFQLQISESQVTISYILMINKNLPIMFSFRYR